MQAMATTQHKHKLTLCVESDTGKGGIVGGNGKRGGVCGGQVDL